MSDRRAVFALALLAALGCGSPHDGRSARAAPAPAPTPAPTPNPITLRTLIADAEQMEASTVGTAATACKLGASQWTLTDARKMRSEIGHLREQSLDQLRKWSSAEFVEARRHVEVAVGATERACGCLDAVIAKLTDPEAHDEIELEALRNLHMCDDDNAVARLSGQRPK
jgi:hypothetical protein